MKHKPTRNETAEAALTALHLIDLTSLNDSDTDETIEALVRSADTPVGTPAALCIYPRFIGVAREAMEARGLNLPIATVVNFPDGAADPEAAARETADAVALGAQEIDVVFPYRALMAGDAVAGFELVEQCRAASRGKCLKVILETGELKDGSLIRRASEIAIHAGADFIKTSTGKVPVNATLAATVDILATIREAGRTVGFKAAGGVRTVEDAAAYLNLVRWHMGASYAVPATCRFGASGLLANLLGVLGHGASETRAGGY
ncbi:MAG TPA: deoxyribose-phosphate aldolase [Paraburkholderia sp.]|uniref:deoxyribose-phosphate aldolase n=1 Tax=Paraburkholderia sp. TaxID=1926495 RepID=UPI002ED21C73